MVPVVFAMPDSGPWANPRYASASRSVPTVSRPCSTCRPPKRIPEHHDERGRREDEGDWDGRRSIPLPRLGALLDCTCGSWHSLQVDARADERHPALHRLDTRGIVRTAACMRGLDLVITIDSMTAHLAGVLNVPVWTLLAYDADWRWMEKRSDTPWYPSMRLFRQPAPGDWAAVVEDVRAAFALRA